MTDEAFWELPLEQLDARQWEQLCDGCARCCLHRLEDRRSRQVHFTNVACRYLDAETGRCSDYPNRSRNVPRCVTVTLDLLHDPYWLPDTCAYRLRAAGKPLPDWHPLISGDPQSVDCSGHSVRGRVISETRVRDLSHHLIDWVRA